MVISDKMARRYDTKTTIFSPEGRLYQVHRPIGEGGVGLEAHIYKGGGELNL